MNVPGRWLKESTIWRKISLNTWSKPDNPTILGVLEVDVSKLEPWLARHSADGGVKCTMTHAVARAIAIVLRRNPEANVLVRMGRIWLRRDVDVFLQVAMPVPGQKGKADLSGAIIRQADTLPVDGIARELARQAEAVRAKKDGQMAKTRDLLMALPNLILKWMMRFLGVLSYDLNLDVPTSPRDPFGGVMVTSVGMLGIQMGFAPIVTFSRAPMVLLVNQVLEKPVVREGQIVIRKIMTLTAAIDHRVMDGFQAGVLASEMKVLLEDPAQMDEGLAAPVPALAAPAINVPA